MEDDEYEKQWYIKEENGKKGPYSIEDLEQLWVKKQINSLTQIQQDNSTEWKHVAENVDLMNNFIDLQFQQQQNVNETSEQSDFNQITQNINNNNVNINLVDKKTIYLKKLAKEHNKFKEIDNKTIEELTSEDKQYLFKQFKNKKKQIKQKEKQKMIKLKNKINTCIYVKGLPDDISLFELEEFFSKAGVIKQCLESGQAKIKIYKDEDGRVKGDALISYIKPESVDLCIEMLNKREIRKNFILSVQEASFNQQQQENMVKTKKKIDKNIYKLNSIKMKNEEERLFGWDDDDKGQGLQIVILKNMFEMWEVEQQQQEEEIKEEIKQECESKLGPVVRIKIYNKNPEGIVQIKFKNSKDAEQCIKLMNNRYFNQRQLQCFYYDGVTDYNKTYHDQELDKIQENLRIQEFGNWIENQ